MMMMMMMMTTIYFSCIDVNDIPGFSFLFMKFDIFVVQDEYVTNVYDLLNVSIKVLMYTRYFTGKIERNVYVNNRILYQIYRY